MTVGVISPPTQPPTPAPHHQGYGPNKHTPAATLCSGCGFLAFRFPGRKGGRKDLSSLCPPASSYRSHPTYPQGTHRVPTGHFTCRLLTEKKRKEGGQM